MSAHQGAAGVDTSSVSAQEIGASPPANGDRDSVDDVIERLLSVRGACSVFFGACKISRKRHVKLLKLSCFHSVKGRKFVYWI